MEGALYSLREAGQAQGREGGGHRSCDRNISNLRAPENGPNLKNLWGRVARAGAYS